jgi:hypothetical protein
VTSSGGAHPISYLDAAPPELVLFFTCYHKHPAPPERALPSRAYRRQADSLTSHRMLLVHKALLTILAIVSVFVVREQSKVIDFKQDVEPILAANCIQCHGAKTALSGLRLDRKDNALVVITPGSAASSSLIRRVTGQDQPRMPMGKAPLSNDQIATLRAWIDQGANWPDETAATKDPKQKHWSFVTPVRPRIPTVKRQTWVRNPIDAFVLAQLERSPTKGLAPSPEANRTTLIRRLSLDLTGLPPSPSEIDAFLKDLRPGAYERLVDRLLDSPHYGERWGRWWLDAARYADTNGFEKDRPRSIWPYRDWVIGAFNRNLPFDRFVIDQLAGDLVAGSSLEQRVATGFLRNSMLNEEGGVDPEQFRVEGIIDRVDAVGKAFLGLTINCAQCHTHKFDPITHREYYQFYAFLNNDVEPEIEVPDAEVTKKRAEINAEIAKIEKALIASTPDIDERMKRWETSLAFVDSAWQPLENAEIFAAFGTKFDRLEDGSFIAKGDNSTSNNYKITARSPLKSITGFRLELLTDPTLPRSGPGRANDGSFFVTEFSVDTSAADRPEALSKVVLTRVTSDFEREGFPVSNVIDGDPKTHWSSDAGPGRRNQSRTMVFETSAPISVDGGTLLNFQLAQKSDEKIELTGGKPNIGRFRISVTSSPNPKADPAPAPIRAILSTPPEKRTSEERSALFSYYRTTMSGSSDKGSTEANRKIDEIMKGWPYGPATLALAPRTLPRETRMFLRGDWKRSGDAVTPGTPAVLHKFPAEAPRNRLGLARWIVDKDNPLTARVIVNRVWQQYFGEGLVTTPEDFGTRSDKPSHPELLDWLAVEFREKGWSWKQLHRTIVTSATYRQSSSITPAALEADPGNRWLARAPRFRVDSEIVRDIALSAAGLLNPAIGGPSFFPPIPDGVLNLSYGSPMKWETNTGTGRYRRAMYTFWKRSVPYPSLLVFDQPNGDLSCTRRVRSNTPLQALTTLNDQVFVEAAQGLALRVFRDGGATDRERMIFAFRLCTGRRPDVFELNELLSFLQLQQKTFTANTARAVYVSSQDIANLPDDVDLHKVAPWTMVARLLLNLDETITKE